ncbi:MAG: hypothetical protein ABEH56_04840 [Salinirussus sp.]
MTLELPVDPDPGFDPATVLSEAGAASVQGGVIDVTGWAIGLGGLLLTGLWLRYLIR